MSSVFDLTMSSSYNPAFITANGGTVATAEAALIQGSVQRYMNIHTTGDLQANGSSIRSARPRRRRWPAGSDRGSAVYGWGRTQKTVVDRFWVVPPATARMRPLPGVSPFSNICPCFPRLTLMSFRAMSRGAAGRKTHCYSEMDVMCFVIITSGLDSLSKGASRAFPFIRNAEMSARFWTSSRSPIGASHLAGLFDTSACRRNCLMGTAPHGRPADVSDVPGDATRPVR